MSMIVRAIVVVVGALASGGCGVVETLPAMVGGVKAAVAGKEMTEQKRQERTADAQPDLFERLDDDRNGRLDRNEVRDSASLAADWQRLDRDGDGTLDREQFSRR
jgi:hypothetical protein